MFISRLTIATLRSKYFPPYLIRVYHAVPRCVRRYGSRVYGRLQSFTVFVRRLVSAAGRTNIPHGNRPADKLRCRPRLFIDRRGDVTVPVSSDRDSLQLDISRRASRPVGTSEARGRPG